MFTPVCDIHTHSVASGHGTTDTVTTMAKAAAAKGITLLGLSEHGPATMCSATPSYFRACRNMPRDRFGVRLLYGVECNILDMDGHIDLTEEILGTLDYGIVSLHRKNIRPGTKEQNTEACLKALAHTKIRMLGHPDDPLFPLEYKKLVSFLKEHQQLIELNEASLVPGSYRAGADSYARQLLALCREYEQPIVLSSDSHGAAHIGDFTYGLKLCEEMGFPKHLILNDRVEVLLSMLRC